LDKDGVMWGGPGIVVGCDALTALVQGKRRGIGATGGKWEINFCGWTWGKNDGPPAVPTGHREVLREKSGGLIFQTGWNVTRGKDCRRPRRMSRGSRC